jgi:catalase
VVWNEAVKINGADPDFHRRDMWEAIEAGDHPQWDLGIQVFDDAFADDFAFDILDATKIIPEEQVPVRIIGTLTLDANVDNFFAETEQVAFCTQNIVRGIDFTNDPLLQGRNFSYLDTQLKRLGGPNFTHIPINAPQCPVRHYQQDGHMAMRNPRGRANYEPNSWDAEDGPRENPAIGFVSHPAPVQGDKQRLRSERFADHYSQARQFWISQTEVEQRHIAAGYTFELSKCRHAKIRLRMLSHLMNVHDDLAAMVAEGLGVTEMPEAAKPARAPITDLPPSDALSILKNGPDSFVGRKLGLFLCDGADADLVAALEQAFRAEGAMVAIVAPHIQGATLSDGSTRAADEKIDGGPSVLFDAVALVLSEEGGKTLALNKPAQDFVSDAFAHAKFIGWTEAARPLLQATGVAGQMDDGMIALDADRADGFVRQCRALRFWPREDRMYARAQHPGKGGTP